jgi:NAD(P)-dependent dehydrogenase (short-subunit alcohol dehydrogenase family)
MKHFVITGASTGIGRACAEHLDSLGHTVYAGVRKDADAEALQAAGERIVPLRIDVTKPESIAAAVQAVPVDALDGLVNNAGIAVGGPMEFLPLDDFRWQMEVNFFGVIAVSQAFGPKLRAATGRLVHVSSMGGKVVTPFFGPYCASKFAVEAIADAQRRELAPWGMKVAVIEPGSVDTAIWGKGLDLFAGIQDKLSPEGWALYSRYVETLRSIVSDTANRGIPAIRVAKAVEHALLSPRPKPRYPIGSDARGGLFASKWLGDGFMDWTFGRLFKS